jgi:hypothetical protein
MNQNSKYQMNQHQEVRIMPRLRFTILAFGILLLAAPFAFAAPPESKPDPDALKLAARIDQLIDAGIKDAGVEPAPLADDAEFLRRAYLDIAGRVPGVSEARAFLNSKDPDKRRKLIDKLLQSPAYAVNFANVWRALLLPEASTSFQVRFQAPRMEAWLRRQFSDNIGYDKMVRELLTTPVNDRVRRFDPVGQASALNPASFYIAKELKPENLAASTAKLFLGTKLECAQCHDHPFAKWSRNQFWEYAAFFAGFDAQNRDGFVFDLREVNDRREIAVNGGNQVVQAGFLDGAEPQWKYKVGSRVTLAEWVTKKDNPYFAKAAVNRMWGHFFGIGIVEPIDDLGDDANKPSHPDLLEELAKEFADHDFDAKFLIRAIANSKAYQRASAATAASPVDPRLFAIMPVKGLTGEQLFDSLSLATGFREDRRENNPFDFDLSPRNEFLSKFAPSDKRTETQTSILQALAMMNGKFIADATHIDRGQTLSALIDAPFLDDAGRVETLYLAAYARKPRPEEADRMLKYVQSGGPKKDKKAALADVFWALLNSSEFMLNH